MASRRVSPGSEAPVIDPDLIDSWVVHLRAERKSPQTIKSYLAGVRGLLAWCESHERPFVLDRDTLAGYVADLLDDGAEAATARARQLGVRRFSDWLAEEAEIPRDELIGVKPPKLDKKVVESLTEAQIGALIKSCSGKEFRDRRDEAIVRLMVEVPTRAGEIVAMELPDLNLTAAKVIIRRGKGGKGRPISFGPRTAAAIDRYMRMRKTHRLADTPALWLGERGKGFTYDGLYRTLTWRASLAGIPNFHPHILRHTASARWLAAGGSEGGLMAVAGWSSRDMIDRYTKATAAERAAEEARRLNLGDF